jgi:hypothetical protein
VAPFGPAPVGVSKAGEQIVAICSSSWILGLADVVSGDYLGEDFLCYVVCKAVRRD